MFMLLFLKNKKLLGLGVFLLTSFTTPDHKDALNQLAYVNLPDAEGKVSPWAGAWKLVKKSGNDGKLSDGATAIKILSDGRFTVAYFDVANKKFLGTYGGTYTASDGQLTEKVDFNTWDSTQVGTTNTWKHRLKNNQWQLVGTQGGTKVEETWQKVDERSSPLAGAWRIREREQDGQMTAIKEGPRKTIKMMSGDRFQWIAFNTATKQFSGTGGGTYTLKDGKYTETIEFFSRDPGRVGMQLSFNYELKGNDWHHTGQSTTGNRINEVWVRE